MFGKRVRILIFGAGIFTTNLTGCRKQEPVVCHAFAIEDGSQPGLITNSPRPTRRFSWSNCVDSGSRKMFCETAHKSAYKCWCETREGSGKTHGVVDARTDGELPDDRASASEFANRMCKLGVK